MGTLLSFIDAAADFVFVVERIKYFFNSAFCFFLIFIIKALGIDFILNDGIFVWAFLNSVQLAMSYTFGFVQWNHYSSCRDFATSGLEINKECTLYEQLFTFFSEADKRSLGLLM